MIQARLLTLDTFREQVVETVNTFALSAAERSRVDIQSTARGGHGARGYGRTEQHDLEIAWWVHPERYGREASFLYESLALQGSERILSIGCGPALHEATIAGLYPHTSVVATDLDPEEIATAREVARRMEVENIEHHALKAEELGPVASQGAFDRIISLAVLHDIGDLSGAMKTVRGFLKDDGVFAFTYNPYRRHAIFPDAPVLDVVAEEFEIVSERPLVTPEDSHRLYGDIAALSEEQRGYSLGWDAVVAVPRQ